jgi:ABC-type transport system involved in cytochrome c biogenesis permease subunit
MPTTGQLALLIFVIVLFAAGGAVSIARIWWDQAALRLAAKQCLYWGVVGALAVLVWHSAQRGNWLPLEDNFDAFVWLAILLTLFVLYVERTKPIVGLDWFILPVVVLLLVAGGVFGRHKPQPYTPATWSWVHRVSAYGGFFAFAVAGAVGAMYLITNARLRRKAVVSSGSNFGSLERLEHFTRISVTLGFALLTIGLITGLVEALDHSGRRRLGDRWFLEPKVVMAFGVWIVYALVLHAPINPSFRGRKAAMLSIVGFVLMIGTLIAVQFMPAAFVNGGGGR